MHLHSFPRLIVALAVAVGVAASGALTNPFALKRQMRPHPEPRTNVLFLIADDLNCDLGCYGAAGMRTPHLDRLAARGVRFERAYCQIPLCSPSRTSLLTGRRPDATGVTENPAADNPYAAHFRTHLRDVVTLPQLFKQDGWFAARVGKIYHYGVPYDIGTAGLDDLASWDLTVNPRGRDRELHDTIYAPGPERTHRTLGAPDSGFTWFADPEGADGEHTDGIGATEAIELLERFKREERPFFLAVGFYRPHTPYVAPAHYFDLYPAEAIELPGLSAEDRKRHPRAAYATWRKDQEDATEAQRRGAIQAYRASISFVDAQVGRVVDALDRLGLAENTVIVFTSDHGYHLGDHGLWHKMSLFERSARVPLIIAAPGARAAGRTSRSLVELLDLYPTLADLAGIPAASRLDGVSLRPILDDASATVKTAAFSQIRERAGRSAGYAVRTERWRYIEWDSGSQGVQLYDLESDPDETTNLAGEARHAGEVQALRALLEQYRAR